VLAELKGRLSSRDQIIKIQLVVTSIRIHVLSQRRDVAAVGEPNMTLLVGVAVD
jgi:hypothetical protein